MKPLIATMVSAVLLFAGQWQIEHNFSKALQEAKMEKKEVMMVYSAPWCPECNYMKEVVFKDKRVAAYMRSHFILLILDVQKDELPKGFDYRGIPTFFFVDADGRLKGRIVGGSKPDIFLRKLKALR